MSGVPPGLHGRPLILFWAVGNMAAWVSRGPLSMAGRVDEGGPARAQRLSYTCFSWGSGHVVHEKGRGAVKVAGLCRWGRHAAEKNERRSRQRPRQGAAACHPDPQMTLPVGSTFTVCLEGTRS